VQQLTTRGWRRFKAVLRPATQIVFPPTPRAQNDYATHVPVLIGVAGLRKVERVLELGCGNYSTKTFLNRAAFPHLKELQSIENDPAWGQTIRDAVKHDSRCRVNIVDRAMADAVSKFDLEQFDLIFVDDSTSAEQRSATITALSALHPQNPWLLIHDYEVPDYQRAAAGFKNKFVFKAYNPETGLVFNLRNEGQTDLRELEQRLKENCSQLEPDDIDSWLHVLRK
jgi:hypothetical protein